MIETKNLTKVFKNITAVKNLNISIDEGDIYGFIGPNGAGKTTTIKMLATLMRPTSGTAFLGGHNINGESRQVRRLIGYMPDFFGVYEDMKVSEYLEFFAAAYRIRGPARRRIVKDVLALTDLEYKRNELVQALSRGMQQRLGLARVLIHDPKVLLLDEPASGLDPRARIEIRELLKELQRMGKTILISSHILSELGEMCNSIGIIEQGKLVFSGDLETVMEEVRGKGLLFIRVDGDCTEAADAICNHRFVTKAEVTENGELFVQVSSKAPNLSFVSEALVEMGFPILAMKEEEVDLEDVFMRLTKGVVS
ncbi:MAG: ABC transporter ATP-binding protein [Planctomycetota bacterium]|nr:MAG: ABC transporter ATP-binding protein [Planctomycetota bacterium]